MKTVLGVDMAKDPSFTAAQVFDGARMGLAPKVVLITDPPILTPFGFRKAFLDHFEKLVGETYEQASARMFPLMAEITPKMRRSEEHTSELQSLMRISYAVFCLKKKSKKPTDTMTH